MNTAWFKDRLREVKLSQRQLAKRLGLDAAAVSLMFRGKRAMKPEEARVIGEIFGLSIAEIFRQSGMHLADDVRECRIAGSIDETGLVLWDDTGDLVHAPSDCPDGTIAIQARCPTSHVDGWLLFVAGATLQPGEALGRVCLVRTQDDSYRIGTVRRGYRPGRFNLVLWPDAKQIVDASLVQASEVLWIKTDR